MTIKQSTTIREILSLPVYQEHGRLLFPMDRPISLDMTLEELTSSKIYMWYSYLDVNKTIEILESKPSFYNIYTQEEMLKDPSKRNTGLFFFKGKENAPYAICNAGGGFMYVGAMHDSFPHALEISKRGYNAFALIYRVDHPYIDLARAIAFIHDHADYLKVDKDHYSLWGGSAGARMAATLGNKKIITSYMGQNFPGAEAVIMQYTGYDHVSQYDAPTYVNVGTSDYIADYRVMKERLIGLSKMNIPTEYHCFKGLPHGYGLGTGTIAQGWIDDAIQFWEKQMH